MTWYLDRDHLKEALSIPVTATRDDRQLDAALEGVSRLIDSYLGYPVYAHRATRYVTAQQSGALYLSTPLLSITALRTDAGGDASYEATWSTGDYWLTGAGMNLNPRAESPPKPYWELHTRQTGSNVFPARVVRGVEIDGFWGYYDERETSPAQVATGGGWDGTATSLVFSGASSVHPGQTLLVDTEQIFVKDKGTSTDRMHVDRGVNGTTAATHASAAAIAVYTYPVIDQAMLFQAAQDFSGRQGSYWTLTANPYTNEQVKTAAVGLHPFTRRLIDPLRMPTVR